MAHHPDPVRPGFPIALDKPRRLLLDLNALITLQEKTGKNMLRGEGWAQFTDPDPAQIRLLLWAALLHEDPELTPEQVGTLIHTGNLEAVQRALEAATSASLPEPEPEPEPGGPLAKAPKRRRRRPGSNSGASAATT